MQTAPHIRGVLFDKDGTLIEFMGTWMPVYRAIALRVAGGRGALAEALMVSTGWSPVDGRLEPRSPLACGSMAEILALWRGHPDIGDTPAGLEALATELASSSPVALAELPELFGRLRGSGLVLGVATMDSTASARRSMASLGVLDLLDYCVGYDAGYGVKPGAEMALGFCEVAGLEPTQIAVVGDTLHDIHMARAAGAALVVGMTTGMTPPELLAEADHVLDHLAELPALFANQNGEGTSPSAT